MLDFHSCDIFNPCLEKKIQKQNKTKQHQKQQKKKQNKTKQINTK